MQSSRGSPIIPIPSRINPIAHIDTNIDKIWTHIIPFTPSPLSSRFTCYNFKNTPIFFIVPKLPVQLKLLNERYKLRNSNCERSPVPWAQIFTLGSCSRNVYNSVLNFNN